MKRQMMLNIVLANNNRREQRVKEILCKLLNEYNLAKYLITKKVIIQSMAIPHSHPILTLNTRTLNKNTILSVFLHEQMHWYLENKQENLQKIIIRLKMEYPKPPVELSESAKTKKSTYLHLIVNFLEYKALIEILGASKARKIILAKKYYTWIYKTAIEDYNKLEKLFENIL
jgi:hypothetical protein